MKYRIKQVIYEDGHSRYYPQYKRLLFWHYILDHNGYNGESYRDYSLEEGAKYIILRYIGERQRYNTVSKKYIPVSI